MVRLAILVVVACGAPPSDRATEPVDVTGEDTGAADTHGDCPDYVRCLSVVAPDRLGDALALVGDEGSCWADDDAAPGCEEMCTAELVSLLDEHPTEPACGGSTPEFPFEAGEWTYTDNDGACYILGQMSGFELEAGERDGEFLLWTASLPIPCTLVGDDYTCSLVLPDFTFGFEGRFTSSTETSGTMSVADESSTCEGAYAARFAP